MRERIIGKWGGGLVNRIIWGVREVLGCGPARY